MSRVEVERGRRYYCEVIGDEGPLAGTLVMDRDGVRASLVRFDRLLPHEAGRRLTLRTEGNWYASLFDLVPAGWSQQGAGPSRAYVQDTWANVAVVGWDAWADDDLVRQLTFRLPGTDTMFEASPQFGSIMDADMVEMPELGAFEVRVDDAVVKAWLQPSGRISSNTPTTITPWLVVEYDVGRPLAEVRHEVTRIVRFFSVCSGRTLRATEIVVSRHGEAERLRRMEAREPTPEHRVFGYEGATDEPAMQAEPYSTLLSLWSDDGRHALEASLAAWMRRDDDWAPAAAMMADGLARQRVMSSSRLLSATRCLEEIPGAAPRQVIPRDVAKALGKLVGRAAGRLGYGALAGRFSNAVSKIALESNRERLARLVADVRATFGDDIVDEHVVDWLAEALSMRGRAAHGARTALDEEYEVFARAVEAMECVNALLMLKDLPLGADAVSRASRHPLVQQYRGTTLPGSPKTFRTGLAAFADPPD